MLLKMTEQTMKMMMRVYRKDFLRPRCGYRNNIKMNLRETGYADVHWIELLKYLMPCFCNCGGETSVSITGSSFLSLTVAKYHLHHH
jgi:hypothetical protein